MRKIPVANYSLVNVLLGLICHHLNEVQLCNLGQNSISAVIGCNVQIAAQTIRVFFLSFSINEQYQATST